MKSSFINIHVILNTASFTLNLVKAVRKDSPQRDMNVMTRITFIFLLAVSASGCEEFVEIDPPKTEIIGSSAYVNDATAISVISGIYSEMTGSGFAYGGARSITMLEGLSADEFVNFQQNADYLGFYTNSLLPVNGQVKSLWESMYKMIYYANSVLEGLENASGVTTVTKAQLQGEARVIRAFSYFYLVNLWGDVPLVTTTDYRINSVASRAPQDDVYEQIVLDLQEAQELLIDDYSEFGGERVRPNKWAATALLARVYLYMEDWANAEAQATEVINHTALYGLEPDLNRIFLANSMETIWQLMPTNLLFNTWEGEMFISTSTPRYVSLTGGLLNAFEVGDSRFVNWVDSITVDANTYYFPFKYKIKTGSTVTEYSMVLRLAEQYLIRAEARTHQPGKLTEAIADVDAIRGRADLPLISDTNPTISQEKLLQAIEHERRIELFSEWGHRWLDLKRTNRATAVLADNPAKNWKSYEIWHPIPLTEIENNPNLMQTPGYNE